MPAPTLDSQLCFALYSASNHLTSIYRAQLEPHGLTYTQFIVMLALWQEDGVSISRLAETVGLSKPTMTPLLKRLEQKGLIQRVIPVGNERQKNIILTDSGRALSEESRGITDGAFCETTLSKAQASDLIALCQLIVNREGALA